MFYSNFHRRKLTRNISNNIICVVVRICTRFLISSAELRFVLLWVNLPTSNNTSVFAKTCLVLGLLVFAVATWPGLMNFDDPKRELCRAASTPICSVVCSAKVWSRLSKWKRKGQLQMSLICLGVRVQPSGKFRIFWGNRQHWHPLGFVLLMHTGGNGFPCFSGTVGSGRGPLGTIMESAPWVLCRSRFCHANGWR